jgi:hypothetical protein
MIQHDRNNNLIFRGKQTEYKSTQKLAGVVDARMMAKTIPSQSSSSLLPSPLHCDCRRRHHVIGVAVASRHRVVNTAVSQSPLLLSQTRHGHHRCSRYRVAVDCRHVRLEEGWGEKQNSLEKRLSVLLVQKEGAGGNGQLSQSKGKPTSMRGS